MSYKVGRGGMLDGLDEALAGMSAGEEKTFTSQLVGGDLVGQDVDVAVTVTQVQEQELPEFDDEFAQLASEFDTAEELTDDVRERLGRGKRLEQAAAARDAVLEELLERVEVPLPETVVTDELNSRRQNIEQQLALRRHHLGEVPRGRGPDPGGVRGRPRAPGPRRRGRAVRSSTRSRPSEELGVDQQELTQHMVRRAQQSGQDPQEFANHMFEHNHVPELVQEIRRGKALAQIVEAATVTDALRQRRGAEEPAPRRHHRRAGRRVRAGQRRGDHAGRGAHDGRRAHGGGAPLILWVSQLHARPTGAAWTSTRPASTRCSTAPRG